ncbi:MAG: ABC transporter ATP-binding protein [Spirochaetales bacterium]|nr:ABC transporter ATP-binding protein [Spirochaetales bacterium]
MLEVKQLTSGYSGIQVLWDISLEVKEGEIVALVGGNGAGKTTTLISVAGILKKMGGEVLFEGDHIEGFPAHKIITRGIALVPEGRRVFPYMTVKENLEMGAFTIKEASKIQENMEWVFSLFPKLKERQSQLAGTFSGGEQQMLVIGRALMSRPRFIMLDEPSMGLQPSIVQNVFESLKILHSQGVTILLVEQNVRKSLELAERAYVIEHGRIVMSGQSKDLLKNDEVRKAYLGI